MSLAYASILCIANAGSNDTPSLLLFLPEIILLVLRIKIQGCFCIFRFQNYKLRTYTCDPGADLEKWAGGCGFQFFSGTT